jgi:hypothetical protein
LQQALRKNRRASLDISEHATDNPRVVHERDDTCPLAHHPLFAPLPFSKRASSS